MTAKRGGLGRNLSALLSRSDHSPLFDQSALAPLKLAVTCLQPGKYQPRGGIDETTLAELAESIKQQGLLQPIVVREITTGQYEIIAGERRWRASQLAGLAEVPVMLRQVDDETAMAMALIENLQREDLNAMDQARAMQRLTAEFGLTHQQVADLLCKSRTAVSNYLRLFNLNSEVRQFLEHGDLDMGHARALLMLSDEQQCQIAQLIIAKELSVRDTEKLVARVKAGTPEKIAPPAIAPIMTEQLQTLAHLLRTKVKIKPGKAGKGMLIIHYDDSTGLQKMIDQLIG